MDQGGGGGTIIKGTMVPPPPPRFRSLGNIWSATACRDIINTMGKDNNCILEKNISKICMCFQGALLNAGKL